MLRTTLVKSSVSRSIVATRRLHSSPVPGKTVTEKVSEVADKVNKSVGKGLASAIDTGEKVVDSTKQTLGSGKRKATDAAQEAKGTAQEKMGQASESTKQATENAKQKVNQTAGEAGGKLDRPVTTKPGETKFEMRK